MLPVIVAALLKAALPTMAGAVLSAGKDIVQDKLGVNLDEALGSEEGRLKLKQLEVQNAQFLAELGQRTEQRALESFQAEIADRSSARQRDAEFVKAGTRNYRADFMFMLAAAAILWMVYLIWKSTDLTEFTKGILTLVLGRFLGYLDAIYNFEFGTTRSSRQKDSTIEKLSGGQ